MRRGDHEVPVLTTEMDRSAAVLPCHRCGSRRGRWRPPARHRASRDERPGRRSNLISRRDDRRRAAISPAGTLLQRCYRVDGWLPKCSGPTGSDDLRRAGFNGFLIVNSPQLVSRSSYMPFRHSTHLPIGGVLSWKRLITGGIVAWITQEPFIHSKVVHLCGARES